MAKVTRSLTYQRKYNNYRNVGDYRKAKKYGSKFKKVTGYRLPSLKPIRLLKYPLSFATYRGMTDAQRKYRGLAVLKNRKDQQKWKLYLPKVQEAEARLKASTIQLKRAIRAAKVDKKIFSYYATQRK